MDDPYFLLLANIYCYCDADFNDMRRNLEMFVDRIIRTLIFRP